MQSNIFGVKEGIWFKGQRCQIRIVLKQAMMSLAKGLWMGACNPQTPCDPGPVHEWVGDDTLLMIYPLGRIQIVLVSTWGSRQPTVGDSGTGERLGPQEERALVQVSAPGRGADPGHFMQASHLLPRSRRDAAHHADGHPMTARIKLLDHLLEKQVT